MLVRRIYSILIILIVILSVVSPVQSKEAEEYIDDSTNTDSEITVPSAKIAASPGIPPIQWNKIDKDSSPSINTEGQIFNTDLFTGSAGYSYAIEVPPGINGLEPNIILSYNHHSTNSIHGELGTGWSLNNNYIYRDINNTRSDTSDDIFWINFNGIRDKLVYVPSEDRYYTEHESYLNIKKARTSSNDKGEYWIIISKDGTKYEFGSSKNSEQISNQEDFVTEWSLSSVTDKNGNRIRYEYDENPNGEKGSVYLASIAYNAGINMIDFEYDFSLLKPRTIFSNANEIKRTGILKIISVKHNGNVVRKYVLEYSMIGTKLFLTKIREFGKDESSELSPVEFIYQNIRTGWQFNDKWKLPLGAEFGSDFDNGVRLMDINADGLVDITYSTSSDLIYWLNTGDGWGRIQSFNGLLPDGYVNPNYGDTGVRFLDMNGDARTDIISLTSGYASIRKLLINNGKGFDELEIPELSSDISLLSIGYSCNPDFCSPGWKNEEVTCDDVYCTRTCTYEESVCSDNWRLVFEDEGEGYRSNRNDIGDSTRSFTPSSSNKCYAFVVDTPNEIELDVDEDVCIDGKSYDGESVFIAGLKGEDDNSWLKTIPSKSNHERWYGNLDSTYPNADFYYSYIASHESSDGSFDSSDIDNFADDDEILYCTQSQEVCAYSGLDLCGYGCYNQDTEAFVTSGYYRERSNWFESIARDAECDDSNVYKHEGDYIKMEVYEASLVKQNFYEQTFCSRSYEPSDWGARLVDVNADGKTDILQAYGDLQKKVLINKGNQFVEDSKWRIPDGVSFVSDSGKDNGVRLADINGDGMIDIVLGNEKREVWLNNGEGWSLNNPLQIPEGAIFSKNEESQGIVIVDVNGDGLNDLIKAKNGDRKTWMNTGIGWVLDRNWLVPSQDLSDFSTQIADVNGDNMEDVIFGKNVDDKRTFINKNSGVFLLREIKNGQGGKINIDYEKISSFDNTGYDDVSDTSFNGWIVKSITMNNGMTEEHMQISSSFYTYKNGMFDPASREFRGFAEVEETLPDSTKVIHKFYQDAERKGLEYETTVLDEDGNIHKKTEKEFVVIKKSEGYKIVSLHFVKETLYDGSNWKTTGVRLYYDLYGSLAGIHNLGFLDVNGDEKEEKIKYIYDVDKWIVDRPSSYALFGSRGDKHSEISYSYDNNWNLIEEEYWLNNGINPSINYEYDSYGNIISETDPNGNAFYYTYDSTNTFVIKEKNPLNFETQYEYDKSTGNILSVTDPNGHIIEYVYDVFGRKIKEILPYDSIRYPTQEFVYEFDGNAPEKVIVKQREDYGEPDTYDEIYFYDGFGNLIQIKKEAENSRYSIYNIYYDELGRDELIAIPLLYEKDNEYKSLSNRPEGYAYNYDSLGRVVKITNPDDTERKFVYAPSTTTIIDENNHQKKYRYDAYNNIISVIEYSKEDEHETEYNYDNNDNLIKIRDSKGNEIRYNYDSLGRKTQLNDLDLGIWTYSYDDFGNLIRQTDNKGNVIRFAYDELNRPIRKITQEGVTTFVYDREKIGTLSSVSSPGITITYSYDERLRTTRESSIINRQGFSTSYEYDAMDRITKKTLPNNEVITYNYNEQGLIDSLRGSKSVLLNIDYNEIGLPTRKLYSNTLVTSKEYDPTRFRLKKITTTNVQDMRYTYDNAGNIIGIVDSENDNIRAIQYDELDRVTFIESSGDNEDLSYNIEYSYDSIGNIISVLYRGKYLIEYVYENIIHTPSKLKIQSLQNTGNVREKRVADPPEITQNNGTEEINVPERSNPRVEPPSGAKESPPAANKNPIKEICNSMDDDNDNEIDEGNICEPKGDFNKDGKVDYDDFYMLSDVFNSGTTSGNWLPAYGIYDLNADGRIDYDDYFIFADEFNKRKENGQ